MGEQFNCNKVKEALLNGGLVIGPNRSGLKSDIWDSYSFVSTRDGNILEYVQCTTCQEILSAKKSSGTSYLKKHKRICNRSHGISMTTPVEQNEPSSSNGFESSAEKSFLKEKLTKEIVKWCVADIRPFKIIEGTGFQNFVQELIRIGSEKGNINFSEILPSPRTISRHVDVVYDQCLKLVVQKAKLSIISGKY